MVVHAKCGKEKYPSALEINVDTVYRRSNITETEEGYEYDEEQLTLVEYEKEINYNALGELSILLANYRLETDKAIAELSMEVAKNV